MKRFLPLFIVILLAGAVAFGVTQWARHKCCPDEDTWLQTEFSLSNAQLASIKKLRADYGPVCAGHCGQIAEAKQRLVEAEKISGTSGSAYLAAEAHFKDVSRECAEATHRHLEAIAAQMPPEQGRRYLEMVGPKITASPAPAPSDTK